MTKSELIAELSASNPHLRVSDVELLVTTIFDQITDALAHGGRVELRGFGAFALKQRNARMGHNPRTLEAVPVAEKAAPFFKTQQADGRPAQSRGPSPASPGRPAAQLLMLSCTRDHYGEGRHKRHFRKLLRSIQSLTDGREL